MRECSKLTKTRVDDIMDTEWEGLVLSRGYLHGGAGRLESSKLSEHVISEVGEVEVEKDPEMLKW